MFEFNVEETAARLAGVAGAFVSMRFLQGSFFARFSMAVSGAVISYYVSPYLSHRIGIPEGLAGFLLGMFGMAVVARGWELIQAAPIGPLWQAVLDRVRGRKEEV